MSQPPVSEPKKNYAEIYDNCESKWIVDSTAQTLSSFFDAMVWAPNEMIMDHGCGTGEDCLKFQVPYAEKAGSRIYGVDISKSMLDYARAKYSHSNVEYVLGDILSPEFTLNDRRFHKIFSIFALRNVQRKEETVRKWFELLEPGGQLIILNAVETPLVEVVKSLKQDPRWGPKLVAGNLADGYWYDDPPSGATMEEKAAYHVARYQELLTSTGFNVVENFTYPLVRRHSSVDVCAEVLASSNPDVFDKCVESRTDQQRLDQAVREYLLKARAKHERQSAPQPTDESHKHQKILSDRYDEIVTAVAVRAVKTIH